MISVVMDTSNQYLAIGIYKDDKLITSQVKLGSKRQSEEAIPLLNELLKEANIELINIDEMIITKGPGSYTGVRVAMTIAKTLAAISNVKIKAISSLSAYAGYNKAISVIDARSQKVFAAIYDNGKVLEEEKIYTYEEFNVLKEKYLDFNIVGELKVFNEDNKDVDIINNIYELSKSIAYEDNVDLLTPTYIKNVEAKKACY